MLNVTRVVLFKHGVGYFQRTGKVEGNASIELGFKASQMNDVLKSLTALDFGAGAFSALSYESEEPVEKRLEELNLNIPQKGAISSFLDQLKGTRIEVPLGNELIEGQIIGVEPVDKLGPSGKVTEPHLAVLAGGERLVRVPLLEVTEIRFLDESIRRDMQSLLDVLGASLLKNRKRLTIQAVGEGSREVMVSYIVEMPVWKTSYRIMLPGEADDGPLLQGWALVDNTTEDDWKGVRLSLVAGLPISFIHDLYTPRYRKRPVVKVDQEAPVAPPVVEKAIAAAGAIEEIDLDLSLEDTGSLDDILGQLEAEPEESAEVEAAGEPALRFARQAQASLDVQVRTQDVGDLFTYEIARPVDVAHGQSALVPILQAQPEAERVAIYNPAVRYQNPMTAFQLKNTTGLTLEGGPVTVFEGEDYVGEAMLDTLRPDEEYISPYSVELGVHVELHHERVDKGYTRVTRSGTKILTHFERLFLTHYSIYSRLDKPLILFIDHSRQGNRQLEDTPEPVEETPNFWRFRIEIGESKDTVFTVKEIAESFTSTYIHKAKAETIHKIGTLDILSKKSHADLDKLATIVEDIEKLVHEQVDVDYKRKDIEKGQKRLRENIKALGETIEEAALRKRYVNQLASEEDRIEKLKKKHLELKKKINRMAEERNAAIDALELDNENDVKEEGS
ncbi:hypothetical protein ACFL9U_12260 [Thermodesulfobacteriota bacterium]